MANGTLDSIQTPAEASAELGHRDVNVKPEKFDQARFDKTIIGGVTHDSANLHAIDFIDTGDKKSPTNFKMQDVEKPENAGKTDKEILEANGMPKDNVDGRRDQFLNQVVNNSTADVFQKKGHLKGAPTEENLGKAALNIAFEQGLQDMHGLDGYKQFLELDPSATEKDVRAASQKQMFDYMAAMSGEKVTDPESFYKVTRKAGVESLKESVGIKD